MNTINTLQIGAILMGLFGGLAIFLFGMEEMTYAIKKTAGDSIKQLLAKLTTNRFKAVFAGALITAIIQSSSVTTVLIVGFISAEIMTLSQSVGVIMGASIGTTMTVQLLAFNITQYALVFITVGVGLQMLFKSKRVKRYGIMIMGLGMIFFGMQLMSEATRPLRTYQPFIELMQEIDRPILGILLGAGFTALIQSSAATIGIVIILSSQGLVTLESGIALALGANIGTCVTALFAAFGKPVEARQAAAIHIILKILGVIIWFAFIDDLGGLVKGITGDTPRQIANAHTIFNVINTVIFIWFVTPLIWLVRRIVPDNPEPASQYLKPKYLSDILLQTPNLALDRVNLELQRLGHHTLEMVQVALPIVFNGNEEELEALAYMDNNVDSLHIGIVEYLSQLSQENISREQSERLYDYMTIANLIENIGDMIQTNFVESGKARLRNGVAISQNTQTVLIELHNNVCQAIEQSLEALSTSDKKLAKKVRAAKPKINSLADEIESHLAYRLTTNEPNRLATFRIESEMIEYLKRIYYFAKRISFISANTFKTTPKTWQPELVAGD